MVKATLEDSISYLLDDSLLMTGSKGSGKTRTIQKMIVELLKKDKRICLFDFVGKYNDLSNKYGETFLDRVSLKDILNSNRNLFRITFNKDILFFKEQCSIDFLNEIDSKIDYLIIDEAQHFFSRSDELVIEHLLNKGIKLILVFETLECLEFTTVLNLKRMMNELMFHQHHNGLAYLERGEALLIKENKILATVYLNSERECLA